MKPESTQWDTAVFSSLSHQEPKQISRPGNSNGLNASLALRRERASETFEKPISHLPSQCRAFLFPALLQLLYSSGTHFTQEMHQLQFLSQDHQHTWHATDP